MHSDDETLEHEMGLLRQKEENPRKFSINRGNPDASRTYNNLLSPSVQVD